MFVLFLVKIFLFSPDQQHFPANFIAELSSNLILHFNCNDLASSQIITIKMQFEDNSAISLRESVVDQGRTAPGKKSRFFKGQGGAMPVLPA